MYKIADEIKKGFEILNDMDKGHLFDQYLSLREDVIKYLSKFNAYHEEDESILRNKYSEYDNYSDIIIKFLVEKDNEYKKVVIRSFLKYVPEQLVLDSIEVIDTILSGEYYEDKQFRNVYIDFLRKKYSNFDDFANDFPDILKGLKEYYNTLKYNERVVNSISSLYDKTKSLILFIKDKILKKYTELTGATITSDVDESISYAIENGIRHVSPTETVSSTLGINVSNVVNPILGIKRLYIIFAQKYNDIISYGAYILMNHGGYGSFGYGYSPEDIESNIKLKHKHTKLDLSFSNTLPDKYVDIIAKYGGIQYYYDIYAIEHIYHDLSHIIRLVFHGDFEYFYRVLWLKKKPWIQNVLNSINELSLYNTEIARFKVSSKQYDVTSNVWFAIKLLNRKYNRGNCESFAKDLSRVVGIFKYLHNNFNANSSNFEEIINFFDEMIKNKEYDKTLSLIDMVVVGQFFNLKVIKNLKQHLLGFEKLHVIANVDKVEKAIDHFNNIDKKNIDFTKGSEDYFAIKYLHSVLQLSKILDTVVNLESIREDKNDILFNLDMSFTYKGDVLNFRVLRDRDPAHFTVGADTVCCQTLDGQGNMAVIDSYINSNAGVVVLEHDDEILSQSYFHYVPKDNGVILDNVEYNKLKISELNLNQIELSEIYAFLAKHIQQKMKLNYVKCGMDYNKLLNRLFEKSSLPKDPREIMSEEKYSDFDENRHLDLLKFRGHIDLDNYNIIPKEQKEYSKESRYILFKLMKIACS